MTDPDPPRTPVPPGAPASRVPLVRSREQRVLAGVCAGLAEHLGYPVAWVRGAMLVFGALGGAGVLFYVWLWITVPWGTEGLVQPMRRALTAPSPGAWMAANLGMPSRAAQEPRPEAAGPETPQSATVRDPRPAEPVQAAGPTAQPPRATQPQSAPPQPPVSRTRWPVSELLLGGALLIAGLVLVLVQFGVELDLGVILPAMVVLVGVGLTWWQIADRDRPERNQLPRVLGALGLVAVGVLTFFVTARQPNALTVIAAALAVLAGVSLALAPWLLRINRDLISERAARAREAERAEIAAHLHDSVLQTLAAIQQRSEPGSEVARLARGQERELREWLFRSADGAEPPPRENLEVELRAHAAALEETHAVRFEVVGVGTGGGAAEVGALVPEAIVAAAREAMLNAARHAGGEVSVYAELTPERVSIDVTDRGAGLDLDALPEGRMGVRESIIGRMERAGGTVRFVPGPGGTGTSVRLAMPAARVPAATPEATRAGQGADV